MGNTAAKIRTALKSAGFNGRVVTVREPHYGDVVVTIRSADVRISEVSRVAKEFEAIHRCEHSGEILLGGNVYVDVRYHGDVLKSLADEVERRIPTDGGLGQVGTLRLAAEIPGNYPSAVHNAKVWRFDGDAKTGRFYCFGIRHAAERVAVELLDAGVTSLPA